MKYRTTPYRFLQKNWLLVGILCCIFTAAIYPKLGSKQGPLRTEYTVKYGAVFIIFLISGLSLKTDTIFKTIQQYKLHSFIQCFTFLFVPLFAIIFIKFLSIFGVHPWVLKGIITVASMPPPVSSAVILTRAAQGNETAAIFNSILGSFLGIVITPILLLFQLGSTTVVPLLDTIFQLTTSVLLPLIIGQYLKRYTDVNIHKLPLSTISQSALLFVIYTTFCDTFLVPETGLSALDVLFTVFSVLLMQLTLMLISFNISSRFRRYFSPQDIIAIVFCSTHKSLTLGIPILRIMFHGYSHLSQISLPLLVYHPTQIILGGLVVPQLKDWTHMQGSKRPPI
ncbi:sodium/bile acid cotransporter 7-like [Diorhabda sublineata]|uniref:sodium/bile acid cotransporter 7-like n=1 Tax=Diorhabda sublineata TaxID=1163346 RepID=UPI0024E0B6FC|nr:sodium/bile acid cotransporter 7-like [Diorhabda sublineata]